MNKLTGEDLLGSTMRIGQMGGCGKRGSPLPFFERRAISFVSIPKNSSEPLIFPFLGLCHFGFGGRTSHRKSTSLPGVGVEKGRINSCNSTSGWS
jgi:hypothetical protein